MDLKHRLKRLEGGSGPCPLCGPGGPSAGVEVVWGDGFGEEPAEPLGDCQRCGRPRVKIVVTWEDEDGEEGAWGV